MTEKTSILSQSSWWILNKSLTIYLGFDASLLLSDLTSKQDYFRIHNKLDEEGFFFNYKKEITKDTGLSEQRQVKAIEILKKYDLVTLKRVKCIPPKLFYKVNLRKIDALIQELHE